MGFFTKKTQKVFVEKEKSVDNDNIVGADDYLSKKIVGVPFFTLDNISPKQPEGESLVFVELHFNNLLTENNFSKIVSFLSASKADKDKYVQTLYNDPTVEWALGDKTFLVTFSALFFNDKNTAVRKEGDVFKSVQSVVNMLSEKTGVGVVKIDGVEFFPHPDSVSRSETIFINNDMKLDRKKIVLP